MVGVGVIGRYTNRADGAWLYEEDRPGPGWHRHDWKPRQIVILGDQGVQVRTIRRRRWRLHGTNASGTAVDISAEKHRLGEVTFSPVQAARIQAKAASLGLVSGTGWRRRDDMHIEIAKGGTAGAAASAALAATTSPTSPLTYLLLGGGLYYLYRKGYLDRLRARLGLFGLRNPRKRPENLVDLDEERDAYLLKKLCVEPGDADYELWQDAAKASRPKPPKKPRRRRTKRST